MGRLRTLARGLGTHRHGAVPPAAHNWPLVPRALPRSHELAPPTRAAVSVPFLASLPSHVLARQPWGLAAAAAWRGATGPPSPGPGRAMRAHDVGRYRYGPACPGPAPAQSNAFSSRSTPGLSECPTRAPGSRGLACGLRHGVMRGADPRTSAPMRGDQQLIKRDHTEAEAWPRHNAARQLRA